MFSKRKTWSPRRKNFYADCRYRILSDTNSSIKIKTKNSKTNRKCAKLQVSKPNRVKNIYSTIEWRTKWSQYLKIHFIAIKTKTLIRNGQKVDFLIRPLDRLNFGPSRRAQFSFWNDSLPDKIGVKIDEISLKYQKP